MAQVAYEDVVEGTDVQGGILADKKFFLTQRVPQRSRFLLLIEANGGHVVKLEKQADYIIADHMRHDAPSGSLSYTFIEAAIAQGHVPNESGHLAGLAKNTPRPVGSAAPGKSTRTPFSAEDDRQLYEWVKSAELAGVSIKGNELYKQLEAKNQRHTFQSWRDRYIKHLSVKSPASLPTPPLDHSSANVDTDAARVEALAEPRPGSSTARRTGTSTRPRSKASSTHPAIEHNVAPPIPVVEPQRVTTSDPANAHAPLDLLEQEKLVGHEAATEQVTTGPSEVIAKADEIPQKVHGGVSVHDDIEEVDLTAVDNEDPFVDEDIEDWVEGAAAIQDIPVGRYPKAWIAYADFRPQHTAEEWRFFYENTILPILHERGLDEQHIDGDLSALGDHWDLMKVFATQGQPIYTPSRVSGATVTPQKFKQLRPSAGITDRKSLLSKELTVESPKRKLFKPDLNVDSSGDSLKRRRVGKPATGEYPADLAQLLSHDPIVISSDAASNDDELPQEGRGGPLTSDVDLAVQRQLLGEIQHQERGDLTAENLARIEAQHNPPETRRGLDLTENDEDKDQGNYAGYLEDILQAVTTGKNNDAGAIVDKYISEAKAQHLEEEPETTRVVNGASLQRPDIPRLVDTQFIDPDLDMSSPLRQLEEEAKPSLDLDMSPLPSYGPLTTQEIDPDLLLDDDVQLELPEPEGGWEPYSSHISQPQLAVEKLYKGRGKGRISNTQDIFDGETQQPDFDMPDPVTSSSQADTNKPLPEPTVESQQINDDDVDGYIDELMERGFREADIIVALKCTSMRPDLVEAVVVDLANGREIPKNIAGIWTAEEDKDLEDGNALKLKALGSKHGSDEYMARLKFLDDYRDE